MPSGRFIWKVLRGHFNCPDARSPTACPFCTVKLFGRLITDVYRDTAAPLAPFLNPQMMEYNDMFSALEQDFLFERVKTLLFASRLPTAAYKIMYVHLPTVGDIGFA